MPASAHISGGDTGKVRVSPWPSREALLRLVANLALLLACVLALGAIGGLLSGFDIGDGRHQPDQVIGFFAQEIVFFAFIAYPVLLPGALLYLALLAGLAEFLAPRRLRAAAIVLSPLVALVPLAGGILVELPALLYGLAFTSVYGALVRLAHNRPPRLLGRRGRPQSRGRAS